MVIGLKVNNYTVKSVLGQGGMATVYVAEHPVLDRKVAVKVLKRELSEDKVLVGRFINEAKAASAIRHPNIVEVFDVGTLPDGLPYLMMELLEGSTLAQRIRAVRRVPLDAALSFIGQAAIALEVAHGKGIVHRDLKPDNLFLVPDETVPGGERVKVLDFGIAKLHKELTGSSIRTHTGSVMGTPPYMSPEQCRGFAAEIDHRTDIYSLGIILHEMLSGAPPFASQGFGDLLMMHLTMPPPPLRSIDPGLSDAVEAAVLRALEKDRNKRFASMSELKRALGIVDEVRYQSSPGGMPPASLPVASGPPSSIPTAPAPALALAEPVGLPSGGPIQGHTMILPETMPTTLRSTAAQVLPEVSQTARVNPRRRTSLLGGGLAIAAVVAVIAFAMNRRAPAPDAPPTGSAAAPAAEPPPPARAELPPAAAPAPAPAPEAAPPAPPPEEAKPEAKVAREDEAREAGASRRHRRAAAAKHGRGSKTTAEAEARQDSAVPAASTPKAASVSPPPAPPAAAPAAAPVARPKLNTDKW